MHSSSVPYGVAFPPLLSSRWFTSKLGFVPIPPLAPRVAPRIPWLSDLTDGGGEKTITLS